MMHNDSAKKIRLATALAILLIDCRWEMAGAPQYALPPAEMAKGLGEAAVPYCIPSPDGKRVLLARPRKGIPLAELTAPTIAVGGIRINPKLHALREVQYFENLLLQDLETGRVVSVAAPGVTRMSIPRWNSTGASFAFANAASADLEVWIGDAPSGKIRKIPDLKLNGVAPPIRRYVERDQLLQWMPDGVSLLVQAVAAPGIPAAIAASPVVKPIAIGTEDRETPPRGLTVLTIKDAQDELLFDEYAKSQLVLLDTRSGTQRIVGRSEAFNQVDPAPGGHYLLVTYVHRPYSRFLPYTRFPRRTELWTAGGEVVRVLAELGPSDPSRVDSRMFHWVATEPAACSWVQTAQERASNSTKRMDTLVVIKAPFGDPPTTVFRTDGTVRAVEYGEAGQWAMIQTLDGSRRWLKQTLVYHKEASRPEKLLWQLSPEDRYGDPGEPMLRPTPGGYKAVFQKGNSIYLAGQGATPKGDRPFVDALDLKSLAHQRLFQSSEDWDERAVGILNTDGTWLLTRRESRNSPPNYSVRSVKDAAVDIAITKLSDSVPEIRAIERRLIRYKRDDGVELSLTMYLPPGYHGERRLPALMWAYPGSYSSGSAAEQVEGSIQRFLRCTGRTHILLALHDYAVLDAAGMPVIAPNAGGTDTFVDQVAMNAKAAIKACVDLGVCDQDRVAIGGHSYGAFMVGTLLANTNLFRAGVAESGAYNRTLTPFGFQSEARTLWQALSTYLRVSPLLRADRIKEPLLLIHGQEDDNPATTASQSMQMFDSVRGNGGVARLVLLPGEGHEYLSTESIGHVLAEMTSWLDRHLMARPTRE